LLLRRTEQRFEPQEKTGEKIGRVKISEKEIFHRDRIFALYERRHTRKAVGGTRGGGGRGINFQEIEWAAIKEKRRWGPDILNRNLGEAPRSKKWSGSLSNKLRRCFLG